MSLCITASALSHAGKVRINNEDNYYLQGHIRENVEQKQVKYSCAAQGNRFLAAVADGMGGEEYGEYASLFAVQSLRPCSFDKTEKTAMDSMEETTNVPVMDSQEETRIEDLQNDIAEVSTTISNIDLQNPAYESNEAISEEESIKNTANKLENGDKLDLTSSVDIQEQEQYVPEVEEAEQSDLTTQTIENVITSDTNTDQTPINQEDNSLDIVDTGSLVNKPGENPDMFIADANQIMVVGDEIGISPNGMEEQFVALDPQLLNTQAQAGAVLDEARNNLREITKWAEGSTEYMNNYLKFQSPSVSFNGESLNLERNFATKKFHLSNSSYQRTNELSISWRESDDWRVKRYHENWIDLFYDRKNDYYLSHDDPYEEGLYRTITVKLGNKQGIRFNNVIPQTTGGLNLSWSTSPTIVSHSISYYVEDWEWVDTEEEDL